MAEIIAFPGPASEPVRTFDREAYRASVARSAEAFLSLAHSMFDILDRLDGDPDFEPGADDEDDGTAEPALAALISLDGSARWAGFDDVTGGAA